MFEIVISRFACRVAAVLHLLIDGQGKYDGISDDAERHVNQAETSDALRVVHRRAQETSEVELSAAVDSRQLRRRRRPVRADVSRDEGATAGEGKHYAYGENPIA